MSSILQSAPLRERFEACPVARFRAGDIVLAQGSVTGRLLLLEEGAVEVVKDGTVLATIREPGVVFGEVAALLDQPHSADVRAVEASSFRVAEAAELLRADPMATLHIAVILARRLQGANEALVEVSKQLAEGKPRSAIARALDRLAESMGYDGDPEFLAYNHIYRL